MNGKLLCIGLLFLFFRAPQWVHGQPLYRAPVLEKLVEFNREMKSDRLVVSVGDSLIADVTYRGRPGDKFLVYSITKLFSGIAVGLLIEQKLLENPEVPVARFFNEWESDSLKRKVTLRHLLQHTSGLAAGKGSRDIYPQPDFVRFALDGEVQTEPGHHYFYNNKAINIISGIVQKLTGQRLDAYIRQHLFEPLGIQDYRWEQDKAGHSWGMDGLRINAGDLLKVGQLLSQYGIWKGRRILSRDWCELMFQLPLANAMNGTGGYGLTIRSLFFQEELVISAETIERLAAAGLRPVLAEKLGRLRQRDSYRFPELGVALKELFTLAEVEEITSVAFRHLIPLYQVRNQQFVIMHGGEYGLLLTAFPQKNIVIVRFLGEKWGRQQKEDGTGYKYLVDGEIISYMIQLAAD